MTFIILEVAWHRILDESIALTILLFASSKYNLVVFDSLNSHFFVPIVTDIV